MKLWLISQDANNDWDTYDSAVVAAETEGEARNIHPDGCTVGWNNHTWCKSPEQVSVKFLGEAAQDVCAGVVLASFNAG